jgi:thioesterase domain-containing protein
MESFTNELKAAGYNLKKVNYNPFESERIIQSIAVPELQHGIVENIKAENKKISQYWKKEFKFIKSKSLPTDYERTAARQIVSKKIDLKIPAATLKTFTTLCEQEHCSLYNFLIAGFSLFVSRVSNCDDVVIGLFNQQYLIPFRLQLAYTENFSMLIRDVRKKMTSNLDHKDFLNFSEMPLVSILFNYEQQSTANDFQFKDFEHEILINVVHSDDFLILECQYNSELFELYTITSWLQYYVELLSGLIELRTETLERLSFENLFIPKLKERSEFQSSESEYIPPFQKRVKNLELTKFFKSMLVLSNSENQTPICFFHSLNGDVHEYFHLANLTKVQRTVLAFQSLGKDETTDPLTTIEEMANFYIRELKALKPNGPYILAGASMGGIIAFEAACQLIEQGEKVEKLIVFNAFGPHSKLQNFANEKAIQLSSRIFLFFQIKYYRILRMKLPLKLILNIIKKENHSAIKKYEPKSFYGDLHLIRNKSDEFESDPVMGWKGVIKGKIKIYRITKGDSEFLENPLFSETLSKIINDNDV